MNKQIIAIIFGIALISLASAIYPGECESIKFPNQDEVNFTLISNTSSMEGFTWSKEGYIITYCFPTYLASGNYSFEWSNYQDNLPEPIVKEVPGGGGGSRTIYKDRNITVEKIVYVNQTEDTEEPIVLEEEEKIIWPYFFWGTFILAIIFMWYRVVKKERKKKKDKENKNDEKDIQN